MKNTGLKPVYCRRILLQNGFREVSKTGSHTKFIRDDPPGYVILTEGGKGMNRMVWRRVCKENCITE